MNDYINLMKKAEILQKCLMQIMFQGATLAALLAGYQAEGKILNDHPPIKLLVSISGSKFRDPTICDVAYKHPIKVKSVHFIGEKDWLKLPSQELAAAFHNPLIISHPQGHTVPRLSNLYIRFHIVECNKFKFLVKTEYILQFVLIMLTDEEAVEKLRNWTKEIVDATLDDDDDDAVTKHETVVNGEADLLQKSQN